MKKIVLKIFKLTPIKIGLILLIINSILLLKHYSLPKNSLDIINQIETKFYDIRFKIRGTKPMSGIVGALTADDKSIEKFGRWPFRRDIYAQAFQNLKNAGVEWIGLDVLFSEPSKRYLDESVLDLKKIFQGNNLSHSEKFDDQMALLLNERPGDSSLGKTIDDFKNVIQSYYFVEKKKQILKSKYNWEKNFLKVKNSQIDFIDFPHNKTLEDYPSLWSFGVVTNEDLISGQNRFMGFSNNQSDTDGLVRKYELVKTIIPMNSEGKIIGEPVLVPGLGLLTAASYLKSTIVVHFDTAGVDSIELIPTDKDKQKIKIPVYYDGRGRMLVNHYGPFDDIPQISLQDAYDNVLPKQMPKILLFGGTGTGTNDKRPSPFDDQFNGVGFHIAAIDNILQQSFVSRSLSSPLIEISIQIIGGLIFLLILSQLSPLYSSLFVFFILVTSAFVDQYFIFEKGTWMYLFMFYVQTIEVFIFITAFKYFTEEREKRMVKGAFQFYLNPSVIHKIMDNPSALKLGGDKKFLTVFFSDVRGFTTISEVLSPEKLTHLLNEYFTPMTKIVLDSSGLLDKYIGDAMMAVWGAPLELEDHADRALKSSLMMLKELAILQAKWEKEGLPYLDIGIGLNTGDMVVGNMGSDQRFDYTVLGDSVNLGARLEGINKNYGTRIICSEFTKKALKNENLFVLRELDNIRVKGKNEPVKIFEVMDFNEENRSVIEKIKQLFEEGLQEYRNAKWDDAILKFKEVLKISSQDGPSLEFLIRCDYLKGKIFTEDAPWDGIWNYTSK